MVFPRLGMIPLCWRLLSVGGLPSEFAWNCHIFSHALLDPYNGYAQISSEINNLSFWPIVHAAKGLGPILDKLTWWKQVKQKIIV